MQQHRGIVLKRYLPKKQKISILDDRLGRIEASIRDKRLLETFWPGMELMYVPTMGIGVYTLEQPFLVAAPFSSAQQDIHFLHHILELSYYFLELHDVTDQIFLLVQFVCLHNDSLSYEQKSMIIGKFLWQLRHDIEMLQGQETLQRLLALPLESMLKETVDPRAHAYIVSWMRRAILGHPQRAYFKTISFILETGVT